MGTGPHVNAAAAGAIGLQNPCPAIDDAGSGQIGPLDVFHQSININIVVVDVGQAAIDHFHQIMGWNIGGHAHRDTRGAVHQQIRNPGGQYRRHLLGAIVVINKIDRFLVKVRQQFVGDLCHTNFGITHCGCVIAIDGTEVPLTVHQRVSKREILRHPHNGVVNRRITVGMVFTDNIPHDTRGLLVGLVPVVTEFVHGVKHAPVYRLETITHIRQGTAHDHAHGVIEIGLLEFVFDIYGKDFFG